MWSPPLEYDKSFAPSWQWILHSSLPSSHSTFSPLYAHERFVRLKARANPSYVVSAHPVTGVCLMPLLGNDARQLWLVDDSWHADEGFVIINKATGQAMRHGKGGGQVSLVDYDPTEKNDKILWTLGPDAGDGFYALRASSHFTTNPDSNSNSNLNSNSNNTHSNSCNGDVTTDVDVDVDLDGQDRSSNKALSFYGSDSLYLHISKERVSEGSKLLASAWQGGLHQMWSLEPIGILYTIRSRLSSEHALTANPNEKEFPEIRMKLVNETDPLQLWSIDTHFDQSITIHNVGCKLSIRGPSGKGQNVRLGELNHAYIFNMWILGKDQGECYFPVKPVHNSSLCMDIVDGKIKEESGVILYESKVDKWACNSQNQMWGFFPKGVARPIKPM